MRAVASIDTAALTHNLARVRALAPGRRVYAAVKADAYGHGALRAAPALAAADGFAVATLDEAMQLRWAGVEQPIMLLSQPLDEAGLQHAGEHGFEPVLFHAEQLAVVGAYHGPALRVWALLDSGMHRLGFAPAQVPQVVAALAHNPHVDCAGWMTHLACADDPDDAMTRRQIAVFEQAVADLPGVRSIANSAGVVAWPDTHADVVRPGIMLYGSSPLLTQSAAALGLRPAMHLTAPLISRNHIAAGEPIGYGATWLTPEAMDVGIVGIGYGDGYPRHAPSGTPVLLDNQRVALIGRVSMDMLAVDLRNAPDTRLGARATLWGPGLPAEEVAAWVGTIPYELYCQLTPRVAFEYI
ncbi:MAG TPA: alanine racemase [Salinisphaeraceae bacterium]|nr:alanine racemase [Salinisphaeraceae bacterium]